ncbi:protein of unknown function [uncultured Woeseiaceae bacterium]|uniref:Uncharacterized protein n=1 Tax=uncultured Woeseiaceae bacterium TaxID=1983305 RepID=A0A7D9D3J7_9GAMM|nr:protein of unknown function [uncultured Woeseiaceae bacterium]
MSLRWRFETQVPYGRFLAVVSEDGDGFSAEIEGEVLVSPQTGVFRIRDRIITDQHYGPESVRALSLEALRRAVEENIENHIGPVDKWTADPG